MVWSTTEHVLFRRHCVYKAAVLFVDGSCVADVCTRHYRLDCQGSDREDLKSNLWARYSPVSAALWRLALFKMLPLQTITTLESDMKRTTRVKHVESPSVSHWFLNVSRPESDFLKRTSDLAECQFHNYYTAEGVWCNAWRNLGRHMYIGRKWRALCEYATLLVS